MKRTLILFFIFFITCAPDIKAQVITTIAGGGTNGLGDGGQATDAEIGLFCGIAIDKGGNFFIADKDHHRVRKVDVLTGIITTIAGNGNEGYNGDGIAATSAELNYPGWLTFDTSGNLLISDRGNHRIRRLDPTGIITTIAGDGNNTFLGDWGSAINASLHSPQGICVDKYNNLFIVDGSNQRIRKVDANGIISTVVGSGNVGSNGDGGPALDADISSVFGICISDVGDIFIAEWNHNKVRRVDASTQIISTVVGNGLPLFNGDSIIATSASINPFDVTIDSQGNLIVADFSNNRIRRIINDTIYTICGTGDQGYAGDNGISSLAALNRPAGIKYDTCGNLYIADNQNKRLRKVVFDACSTASTNIVNSLVPSIYIFPNPAHSTLTITSTTELKDISLVNMLGQQVVRQSIHLKKAEIDVSYLANGIYFLTVTDANGGKVVKKIVKE